jgi:hypothetical protein
MNYLSMFLSISGILLIGCSGRESLKLGGKVLDESTETSIPYRKVIIHGLIHNNSGQVPVYVDEFFTDSSGSFAYNLRKQSNILLYNFSIVGDSVYGFSTYRLGLTELIKYGRYLTFKSGKLTDFTIAIKRTAYSASPDTLYVSWESNGTDGKKLYPYRIEDFGIDRHSSSSDIIFRWIGGDIESSIKTKVYADKEAIVHWQLFRNGEVKKISDTIFCLRDQINYAYFKY